MVLIAEKGVPLVIINKDMYIEKYMAIFNDKEVYSECRDHTKSFHSKVLKWLLDLKISIGPKFNNQYIILQVVIFYSSPTIHKTRFAFRSIVSASGTSTYKLAKFLAKIVHWYCGNNFLMCQRQQRIS